MKIERIEDIWEAHKKRFVELGGIVENVELRVHKGRRGLFTQDSRKPFKIYAPRRLLIPVEEITLQGDTICVKSSSTVDASAREFFEMYEAQLSWQGGGQDEVKKFLMSMYWLPDNVKKLLKNDLHFDVSNELPTEKLILERFLNSRSITYDGRSVIMPMVDLVNHSCRDGVAFNTNDGVTLEGTAKSEIFARYNLNDCWGKFCTYGFASFERYAYSLPFDVTMRDRKTQIVVKKNYSDCVKNLTGESFPRVERSGDLIEISYVLLGDRLDARRPLQLFRESVKPHLVDKTDEFFVTLAALNKFKFIRLIAACDGSESYGHRLLKQTAIQQLEVMNSALFESWI